MRSLLTKIVALAVVAVMALGLLAVPSAIAQEDGPTYPPVGPGFPECTTLPGPQISIVGSNAVVNFPHGSLNCVIRVVVEVNSSIYDGPVPTNDILTVALPSDLASDVSHTAKVTAYYSVAGITKSDSVTIPASAVAGNAPASVPAATAVAVPAGSALAFSGSSSNTMAATAAALVGAGALTVAVARKREQDA